MIAIANILRPLLICVVATVSTGMYCLPISSSAQTTDQVEVEVMHWWSRGGEKRAMQVLRDEFELRGGVWYDVSGEDSLSVLNTAVSRMAKGYAPTLVQWNSAWEVSQIRNLGLLNNLDQKSTRYLKNAFIENVLDMIMVNGEIVAIPVNVHSENWLWYKPASLIDHGQEVLSNWNNFIDFAQTLSESDKVAIAVGSEARQQRSLFNNVLLGIAGQRIFQRIYSDLDISALKTPEFLQAVEIYTKLKAYSRSFGNGRWEQQVAAVAANNAFTVNMGDWAKGEFRNLGLKLGRDYDCAPAPGTNEYIVLVIDAFVLGQVSSTPEMLGQQLFMDVVTDPVVSETFNYLKGSLSPLREFDSQGLDKCSKLAHSTLSKRGKAIKPHASIGDRGFITTMDHLIARLWSGESPPAEWITDFSALIESERSKRNRNSQLSSTTQ